MAASAVVAASVSAVAVVGASAGAAPSDDEATYIAIPPCRLVDTRHDFQIGSRSTPIGANETHEQQVTGTVGACTIPDGATAVSLNVTAVNPTAPSFLTVFPFGGAVPNASNLNYLPGSAPTPNKVDVQLSDSGALGFYNLAGTVDLVADVGGYYTNTGIRDIVSDMSTKANVADVYTKAQTYSKSQVDGALGTLEDALTIDIGDKVDVGDVYTTAQTYTQAEIDGAIAGVQDAVATVNTVLTTKADDAALTAAVDTINTALGTKADDAAVTAALAALNTALGGKVDSGTVYDKTESDDFFMGRDPDVMMRQGTSDVDDLTGTPIGGLSLLGVTVTALNDGITELVGPAALSDAIKGRADYRLNAIELCLDNFVSGAVRETLTIRVRDETGTLTSTAIPAGLSADGCSTVDVSAATDGSTYYVELDVVGEIATPTAGSVRVTAMESTWGPIVPPSAPPAP